MKGLYLVRHGQANYMSGYLTESGIRKVSALGKLFESHLPQGCSYLHISSPARRAVDTGEILRPVIEKKAEGDFEYELWKGFDQLYTDSTFTNGLVEIKLSRTGEVGMRNAKNLFVRGLEKDVIVVTAHDHILAATGIAFAMENDFKPHPYFRLSVPSFIYEDDDINRYRAMDLKRELGREPTEEEVRQRVFDLHPIKDLPEISTATAVYFDMDLRTIDVLYP